MRTDAAPTVSIRSNYTLENLIPGKLIFLLTAAVTTVIFPGCLGE